MTPDWPEVVRRVDDHAWARDITDHVRADFDRWQPGLVIPGPATPTAWTHHYFCDDDGSALTFAPDSPHRHVCATCGRVYRGEPWDGAWRTTVHNCVAAQAQRAALVLRLSPEPAQRERARAALERIFATYTRDYPAYQPHGVHAGRGRVQPQSLDEAVWAVLLLRALRWAGPDALSAGTRAALPRFARAVADLLRPQISAIHNIHCWLLAAVAECAALLADRELLDWCRDGEFGARAQIARGFHAEGLWFESNAHYHYYAVAALLSYREATGPDGLDQDSAARLSRAVSAPPRLAYSDTRLPAYGDGWPDCWTADFAPHAEAAWTLLPERPVDPAPYYRVPRPGPVRLWGGADLPGGVGVLGPRRSVAALVFGPDELVSPPGDDERSLVWPEAGVAVLRSDRARLTLRFGPDGGWHDHRDKLAVDAETAGGWQSLDLGTSGYGARFTAWMRSPVAHNLMICDGRRQPPTPAGCCTPPSTGCRRSPPGTATPCAARSNWPTTAGRTSSRPRHPPPACWSGSSTATARSPPAPATPPCSPTTARTRTLRTGTPWTRTPARHPPPPGQPPGPGARHRPRLAARGPPAARSCRPPVDRCVGRRRVARARTRRTGGLRGVRGRRRRQPDRAAARRGAAARPRPTSPDRGPLPPARPALIRRPAHPCPPAPTRPAPACAAPPSRQLPTATCHLPPATCDLRPATTYRHVPPPATTRRPGTLLRRPTAHPPTTESH